MKDMLYYRNKINALIEDAAKNGIEVTVKEDYQGFGIYIKDTESMEVVKVKHPKLGYEPLSGKKV